MKKGYCKCGCGNLTPIAYRNRFELGHKKGEPTDYIKYHHRSLRGENSPNFKKDAGYKALHLRVNLIRGKAKVCENCGSIKFVEWANLTGKYEDVNDYVSLCRKCHRILDKTNEKRARSLGKERLTEIANKGWETRRNTSFKGGEVLA